MADGSGALADFRLDYPAPVTITLDTPRTVGTIRYDDTGADPDVASLTLTHPGNVLTMDAGANSPDINVVGTNVLLLDVTLAGTNGLTIGKLTGSPGTGVDSRCYRE